MKETRGSRRSFRIGLFVLLLLTVLDQITKYTAVSLLKGNAGISVIDGVFEFFYLENRGAAFGILADRQWIFIVIALIITAAAIYAYLFLPAGRHYRALRICAVLIASGAAGNMIDRIRYHYVIDFLYFSLIDFPVFNLADCYVVIGAALLVVLLFTVYRNESFETLNPRRDSN